MPVSWFEYLIANAGIDRSPICAKATALKIEITAKRYSKAVWPELAIFCTLGNF